MAYAFPVIVASLLAFYYLVNPHLSSFPIKCVWHELTHTTCPACGTQRALHELAHGHPLAALRHNYFFALSIPYAIAAILSTWYNINGRLDWLRRLVYHRRTLIAYVYAFFAWWIARNILGV